MSAAPRSAPESLLQVLTPGELVAGKSTVPVGRRGAWRSW